MALHVYSPRHAFLLVMLLPGLARADAGLSPRLLDDVRSTLATQGELYDRSLLRPREVAALGRNLETLWPRGSMAILFPDGRAPITDQRAVRRYVTGGKPLDAVALPGRSAGLVSSWVLASQVASANKGPVLALNSGWGPRKDEGGRTYFFQMRPAISQGQVYAADPVGKELGRLLVARQRASTRPVTLYGHCAGAFHVANTLLMIERGSPGALKHLRAISLSIAVNMPRSMEEGGRVVQFVGTHDHYGQSMSTTPGLASPSTRFLLGRSHLVERSNWRGYDGNPTIFRPMRIWGARRVFQEQGSGDPRQLEASARRLQRRAQAKQRMAARIDTGSVAAGPVGRIVRASIEGQAEQDQLQARYLGDLARAGRGGAGARLGREYASRRSALHESLQREVSRLARGRSQATDALMAANAAPFEKEAGPRYLPAALDPWGLTRVFNVPGRLLGRGRVEARRRERAERFLGQMLSHRGRAPRTVRAPSSPSAR
jgi:hypothetical protein